MTAKPSQPAPLHVAQQPCSDCGHANRLNGEIVHAFDCQRRDQPAGESDALDRYRAEHPLSGEPEVATVSEVKAGLALYENWRGKVERPDPGVAFAAGYLIAGENREQRRKRERDERRAAKKTKQPA